MKCPTCETKTKSIAHIVAGTHLSSSSNVNWCPNCGTTFENILGLYDDGKFKNINVPKKAAKKETQQTYCWHES